MRLTLAFLVSPAVGALLFVVLAAIDDFIHAVHWRKVSIYTFTSSLFIGGYPPTLLFGVPAYLILRNINGPKLPMSVLAGALVASAPWVLLPVVITGELNSMSDWWRLMRETAIPAFVCGSGAGFVFWLIAG